MIEDSFLVVRRVVATCSPMPDYEVIVLLTVPGCVVGSGRVSSSKEKMAPRATVADSEWLYPVGIIGERQTCS